MEIVVARESNRMTWKPLVDMEINDEVREEHHVGDSDALLHERGHTKLSSLAQQDG